VIISGAWFSGSNESSVKYTIVFPFSVRRRRKNSRRRGYRLPFGESARPEAVL